MYVPWLNKAKQCQTTSVRLLSVPAVLDKRICYTKDAAHFG
jgi:hypothetical protein